MHNVSDFFDPVSILTVVSRDMASLVRREMREKRRKVTEPKYCHVTMTVREPDTW